MARRAAAWILVASLLPFAVACGNTKSRPHAVVYPRQMAAGRPATCPEGAVDPDPSLPGPMDARCSYNDALGGLVVRVRGKVLLEGEGLLPGAAAEARVVLRSAEPDGRTIGEVLTDAQGGFSFTVVLRDREYVLEALDRENGRPLAERRLVPSLELDTITLVIPKRSEPSTP